MNNKNDKNDNNIFNKQNRPQNNLINNKNVKFNEHNKQISNRLVIKKDKEKVILIGKVNDNNENDYQRVNTKPKDKKSNLNEQNDIETIKSRSLKKDDNYKIKFQHFEKFIIKKNEKNINNLINNSNKNNNKNNKINNNNNNIKHIFIKNNNNYNNINNNINNNVNNNIENKNINNNYNFNITININNNINKEKLPIIDNNKNNIVDNKNNDDNKPKKNNMLKISINKQNDEDKKIPPKKLKINYNTKINFLNHPKNFIFQFNNKNINNNNNNNNNNNINNNNNNFINNNNNNNVNNNVIINHNNNNKINNNFFNLNYKQKQRPNSRYEKPQKFYHLQKRPESAQFGIPMFNNQKIIKYKKNKTKHNFFNNNINIYCIKNFFSKLNQNSEFRKSMEDFILIKDKLISIPSHNISLFAIFDGHNGANVSEFLSKNFHKFLLQNLKKFNFKIEESINQSFIDIDKYLKNLNNTKDTGSTATVVIIDNKILYCANVGDSRCYYVSNNKLNQLTKDHNCNDIEEVKRVEKSQGKVFMHRVFGVLQLTRSIGDLDLKDFGVICTPFVSKQKINKDSQFCILASDGVWDQMKTEEIEEYLKNNNNLDSQKLCNYLVDTSLEKYTRDNVSCIVIQFN